MQNNLFYNNHNVFSPPAPGQPSKEELESKTLKGTIEDILHRKRDNDWALIGVKTESGFRKAAGVMPKVRKGATVLLTGQWDVNPKYGATFKAATYAEIPPTDIDGIKKYLMGKYVRNIGPVLAEQIVSIFGEKTLSILNHEPERLFEVRGIGKKRVQSIVESVRKHAAIQPITIWLSGHGITVALATKIYETYGDASIAKLDENPYRLADDIRGVGFKKADQVAMNVGVKPDSPFRIRSGIRACLTDNANVGNTCMEYGELVKRASSSDYLNLQPDLIVPELEKEDDPFVISDGQVFLTAYYNAECQIADNIGRLQRCREDKASVPDIRDLSRKTGITYSKEQQEAIVMATTSMFSVITGGPGTGKTVTTNAIICELEERGLSVRLAAPTGRAAKRMNEVTGHEAKTIHRLLEFKGDHFERNTENPLDGDALVIDEASMIDTLLMKHLLNAIPDGMRVVIVGDVDQLPSVGAGCVLRDIIDSGCVPVQRLKTVFRQAQGSDIIMNAHAVNEGRMPSLTNREGTDFWFFTIEDKQRIPDMITDIVVNRVPRKFGIRKEDIQVLCPMRKESDPIGSTSLNVRLQAAVNPDGEPVARHGNTVFRIGDKVMQTKNDYNKQIFNGDVGIIVDVDDESDEDGSLVVVDFDGAYVGLNQAELANIDLAYSCTVHKSQGSEYPVVVMPVHQSQYIMLKRNLLYTAITRSKRLCILVGTKQAVATAVNAEDTKKRNTRLKERILENNND